jgi:hypothetical protein
MKRVEVPEKQDRTDCLKLKTGRRRPTTYDGHHHSYSYAIRIQDSHLPRSFHIAVLRFRY